MEKRRGARFVIEGVHGKMTLATRVEILNMSLSGAAVKVDHRLAIGAEYTLKLELEDRTLSVKGVVVWSTLDEILKGKEGEDVPVYSAGMKFTDVITPRLTELLAFIDGNKVIQEKRLGGMRFHIDAPGKALLDYPQPYRVKVISLTGLLIETERRLELDQRCPMEMSLDVGQPLRFTGRIAFCGEVAEGKATQYHVGVEFIDMSLADRTRLDAFIRSLGRP